MKSYRVSPLLFAPFAVTLAASAYAQTWNYQTYDSGGPSTVGYVVLEQRDTDYRFQIIAPGLDSCYQSSLKASVEKTDTTITITPTPRMGGCGSVRFVIKTDGTGGTREFLRGTTWTPERWDRILTIRK